MVNLLSVRPIQPRLYSHSSVQMHPATTAGSSSISISTPCRRAQELTPLGRADAVSFKHLAADPTGRRAAICRVNIHRKITHHCECKVVWLQVIALFNIRYVNNYPSLPFLRYQIDDRYLVSGSAPRALKHGPFGSSGPRKLGDREIAGAEERRCHLIDDLRLVSNQISGL